MTSFYGVLGWCLCAILGRRLKHTTGFAPHLRGGHYDKHVIDPTKRCFSRLVMPTEGTYELWADRFAGRRKHGQLHEGVVNSAQRPRRNGWIVRYDSRTEEFLILDGSRIVTYFIPKPGSPENPFATNFEYYDNTLKY